jgi:hypothetical protein
MNNDSLEAHKLADAVETFARLARINAPIAENWPMDKPLRDFIPGAWPTWADILKLSDALQKWKTQTIGPSSEG